MKKFVVLGLIIYLCLIGALAYKLFSKETTVSVQSNPPLVQSYESNPLSIEYMRSQVYPGSEIVIEETLPPGSNYDRFITSYKSDGLKIYALLTVPQGIPPASAGWPVIIFNHGYIPPEQYQTAERYIAYTDAFSRNGYIVFRSDYRGHGNSEGRPEGAYYSPAYTIDVLNAVSSIKKYPTADPNRIGMWGHSMGGTITLRSMVVSKDIKAGAIWAGVVASYQDLATNWHHPDGSPRPWVPSQREQAARRPGRQDLINIYGSFETNPQFWQSIAPIYFVKDISGPIELQHGTEDSDVPILFSQKLEEALKKAGKIVEFYTYVGDDHNLSNNLDTALSRSVAFFDKYLKN